MVSQLLKNLPGGKDILLKRLKKQQNISANYLKAWAVEKNGNLCEYYWLLDTYTHCGCNIIENPESPSFPGGNSHYES